MPDPDDEITIQSMTSPHHTQRVNRAKYLAMLEALLTILPAAPTGITVAEALDAPLPHLNEDLFPGSTKAQCWLKACQLDLEVKEVIKRGLKSPVRLYKPVKLPA